MSFATFDSPSWLRIASKYDGVKELKGPKHNAIIVGWLDKLGAWWRNDEDAWCGVFCAAVMQEAHFTYPSMYMRAKSWLNWGQRIAKPVLGCIVVFDRKGGGHVGFLIGFTKNGDLLVFGGNQRDAVRVSQFSPERVLGYRIPSGWSYSQAKSVPTLTSFMERSTNEA